MSAVLLNTQTSSFTSVRISSHFIPLHGKTSDILIEEVL